MGVGESMQFSSVYSGIAASLGLTIALAWAAPASAESVMKVCGDQWKAAKAAGTTNGETWPQFLSQCRANGSAAAAPSAPAPAPTTYAPTPAAPAGVKTAKECDAEYAANKAAIKASGQKKKDYVAACRAGTTTASAPMAPAPAPTSYSQPAPAPAPTPTAAAPSSNGWIFPWQKPQPAPAPQPQAAPPVQPSTYNAPAPAQVGSAAPIACPGDTPVWVNTKSHIYHYPGTRNYGTTKVGGYMCERQAMAAGDRAAENEKPP